MIACFVGFVNNACVFIFAARCVSGIQLFRSLANLLFLFGLSCAVGFSTF